MPLPLPHVAAGTAKAAADAWTLTESLVAADGDLVSALEQWEEDQLDIGERLVAPVRELGERSPFAGG